MCRFIDYLPYHLASDRGSFGLLLNDSYHNVGFRHRLGNDCFQVPMALIDTTLLLPDGYFYRRAYGPFQGRPADCREYLFRLWWTLRKLGLPPTMPYDKMIMEAARQLTGHDLSGELQEYLHAN